MWPKVAAVDVGSNATRFVAVNVSPSGVARQALFRRYNLRLGQDVFAQGELSEENIKSLRDVFADVRMHLDERGIDRYRAVATAVFREAANGREVAKQLEQTVGIRVQIIDGAEEARMARWAMRSVLGAVPERALLFDLGGGSLELDRQRGGQRELSLPFGTVRLLRWHPELGDAMTPRAFASVVGAVSTQMSAQIGPREPSPLGVGSGGNLAAIARLAPRSSVVFPAVDLAKLETVSRDAARLSAAERAARYGLRSDRADVIMPAMAALLALRNIFEMDTIVVPGTGLRQALLREQLGDGRLAAQLFEKLRDVGGISHRELRRARLVQALFRGLLPLHGLWSPGLDAAMAAAYCRGWCASVSRDALHELLGDAGATREQKDLIENLISPRPQCDAATEGPGRPGKAGAPKALTQPGDAGRLVAYAVRPGASQPARDRALDVLHALVNVADELSERDDATIDVDAIGTPATIRCRPNGLQPAALEQLQQALNADLVQPH
mgnify:CR=1 FL=1